MATYTTDLTVIVDLDTVGGTAVEPSTLYTGGRSPIEDDTDFPIQGTVHASLTLNAVAHGGILVPGNSGWSSGDYIFGWIIWLAPSTINTYASGGLVMLLGDSASVFNVYNVGGSDFGSYPYGGWQNFVVDPDMSPSENAGTPTTMDYVGAGVDCISKVSKGNPLGFDVFRYGRGEARIVGTGATFALLAAANDASTARWGLFQAIEGGYKYKGLLYIGYGGSTTFTDANVAIVIDDSEWVGSDFNRIEIHNTSTTVTWTNVAFTALGSTAKGEFEMMDNATVALTSCTFTDMSTFKFLSNGDALSCTFRNCGQITHGGGLFTGSIFEGYEGTVDTAYLLYHTNADPDGELDGCSFSKGTALTHAIQFDATNTPTTITLRNISFTGYHATNGNTSSALYFPSTTKSYTVNLIGCTGDISYKVGSGGSVTLVNNPVSLTYTVLTAGGEAIVGARARIEVANGDNWPYKASVTLNRSGTTVTVSHTAHGLSTNDYVKIKGATGSGTDGLHLNGVRQITVTTANAYTYTCENSGQSGSISGTVVATLVIISDTTNGSGIVTASRVYATADQPFSGVIADASGSAPFYVRQNVSGTIDKDTGLSVETRLALDQ